MKSDIRIRPGDWFYNDGIYILIIDKDADIFFIALAAKSNGFMVQCPFVPVHNNVLYEFIEDAEHVGNATTADIEGSIESWIRNNGGHKTYFEISIQEIFETVLKGCDIDLDLLSGDKILPIVFPGIKGMQGDDVSYFGERNVRIGGTRLNAELN